MRLPQRFSFPFINLKITLSQNFPKLRQRFLLPLIIKTIAWFANVFKFRLYGARISQHLSIHFLHPVRVSLYALDSTMSIKIYGNLTVTGNCNITTTRTRSSRRRHRAAAQVLTEPRRNARRHSQPAAADLAIEDVADEDSDFEDVVVENNPVEDLEVDAVEVDLGEAMAVEDVQMEDQAIEHQVPAIEPLRLEAPRCQRDQSAPVAQPERRQPRLRRSSRIARRNNLRRTPIHQRRRPLPSALDRDFWTKIWTLPASLLHYLSPGWHPVWCTKALLRHILWHFSPNLRIPCRTLKRELIELFEYHVGHRYGAYYGI
ncbi:uncharacterized protein MELLADRAFT_95871 [Melampsora larici-populina 98AG31]|uniref:Uncharacterized protein n=1 Tax=Melampsora larici-populina (strain 98AG31 / pathotype 3-4-7) TaxID=747676 RepID=F4RDJ7_MELLP|nr:uncharacterized protein MELLADRAFT_95871 [Melampsora larici-populina 98AG31]EGG09414.1 hypothetical protein MELLADRAFT_95871 [Melampsora larici-populina 98AG31]